MSDADRIAEALERIARSMEQTELRNSDIEEDRGPTFMDYLASGAEVNRAATESHNASTKANKAVAASERKRLEMLESLKKRDDE